MKNNDQKNREFNRFSAKITKFAGSSAAFMGAIFIIVIWLFTGPIFHFSDTWQLIINTGTNLITFLMVFVIQQTQNKDTMALHLKLNELIACNKKASNRLINIEDLTEQELQQLKDFYIKLAAMTGKENIFSTHSLDEAVLNTKEKLLAGA
ncbi:MAG: low affinity iron permease family protein [Sphingobacteriales bacterium]|nr:MAG: low affinity iron permease family protein [Sphingobacteriales bacterium]